MGQRCGVQSQTLGVEEREIRKSMLRMNRAKTVSIAQHKNNTRHIELIRHDEDGRRPRIVSFVVDTDSQSLIIGSAVYSLADVRCIDTDETTAADSNRFVITVDAVETKRIMLQAMDADERDLCIVRLVSAKGVLTNDNK